MDCNTVDGEGEVTVSTDVSWESTDGVEDVEGLENLSSSVGVSEETVVVVNSKVGSGVVDVGNVLNVVVTPDLNSDGGGLKGKFSSV